MGKEKYLDNSNYDFYSINLSYSKTPELDKIVLTEFSHFEEIFNQYKHGEYEKAKEQAVKEDRGSDSDYYKKQIHLKIK